MRCIALDDEPIALALVVSFVRRSPGLELMGAYTDPREAIAAIQERPCDLLFLDLHMPRSHGFDVLRHFAGPPLVIITTAHAEHAAASYDLDAVDYLLKPFAYERFLAAVERARTKHNLQEHGSLTVRSGLNAIRVPLPEITYVESLNDYVKVHRNGYRPVVALSTLKAMEGQLPVNRFLRVHRSFIVQWSKVTQLKDRRLYLPGAEIPVGETYWMLVKERMLLEGVAGAGSSEK